MIENPFEKMRISNSVGTSATEGIRDCNDRSRWTFENSVTLGLRKSRSQSFAASLKNASEKNRRQNGPSERHSANVCRLRTIWDVTTRTRTKEFPRDPLTLKAVGLYSPSIFSPLSLFSPDAFLIIHE